MQFLLDLGADPDGTDFQVSYKQVRWRTLPSFSVKHRWCVQWSTALSKVYRHYSTPMPISIYEISLAKVSTFVELNLSAIVRIDALLACLSEGTLRQQECFTAIISHPHFTIQTASTASRPLLIAACERGVSAEKMCSMLLERGVDVHAIDRVEQSTERRISLDDRWMFRKQEERHCMLRVLRDRPRLCENCCIEEQIAMLVTSSNRHQHMQQSHRTYLR